MRCIAPQLLLLGALLIKGEAEPAQAIFDRAVRSLSAGDFEAAERGFKAVLQQQPANVGAIGNLGILYARTNRVDKAIAEYQKALELSPSDEPILLNLGLVYLREELHGKALPYFVRVLAVDPHNMQARQLSNVCRLYTGQVPAALQDLKLLSEQNPEDQQLLFLLGFAYLKAGDANSARAIFNRMFEAAGPARAQFLLGKASYDAAIFPQAEQSFLEVLRSEPHFPGAHLELGKVYISERRTDDAIAELKKALAEDPNSDEANYFLGSLLVRENRDEKGIVYLEKARRLKPDSYGVYLYLGKAELRAGHAAEAVRLLEQAAHLNPDDPSVQYTLARALKSGGQQAAAAAAFERARNLHTVAQNEAAIPGIR